VPLIIFMQPYSNEISSMLIGVLVVFGLAVIIGSLFFSLRKYSREQAQTADLIKNGQPAQAKVLKLIDTGATINHNPQVILHLEVFPMHGASYTAEVKFYVPRLQVSQVQPGNRVAVKIGRDASEIAVDL